MAPVITLTTDFGRSDHYVAAVKGSIQSVNPQAVIVDICHEVSPAGRRACGLSPRVYVRHLSAGVDTRRHRWIRAWNKERHALALATAGAVFVDRDNGVPSAALPERPRQEAASVA